MYYLTENNEIISDEQKNNMNVKCYNSYITCVEKKGDLYEYILRIYKPNSKGDYIKVWEVNNNESKWYWKSTGIN